MRLMNFELDNFFSSFKPALCNEMNVYSLFHRREGFNTFYKKKGKKLGRRSGKRALSTVLNNAVEQRKN